MSGMIRLERDGAVARVTFDRPERGNALDRAGVVELHAVLTELGEDVELIVFRGAGGRAFCGGADSREMVSLSPEERRQALASFYDACLALWDHPAPSVAVLDGYAAGGGAHLAMACDLRTMAPGAWMQFPSARYGLNITTVWLTLAVGSARTTELMASARRVAAEDARAIGLAQAVCPGDHALDALGIQGVSGLRELKAAAREALPLSVREALLSERKRAVELVGLDRFVEALSRERSATPSSRS